MTPEAQAPNATVYRLSLYHCYLAEALRKGEPDPYLTSRKLAEDLGISEETVRRDLSYIESKGRPGAGYVRSELYEALTSYLGLRENYPVVRVGTVRTLETLYSLFPEHLFGLTGGGYFSELPEEAGTMVGDVPVQNITEIPMLDPGLDVKVALVACSQPWIDTTLDLLQQAGITGVLLLTPKVRLDVPDGMTVRHIRMPCDIKSLACGCKFPSAAEG